MADQLQAIMLVEKSILTDQYGAMRFYSLTALALVSLLHLGCAEDETISRY